VLLSSKATYRSGMCLQLTTPEIDGSKVDIKYMVWSFGGIKDIKQGKHVKMQL